MDLWQVMMNLEGRSLRTLDKGHRFEIVDVSENMIIVKPFQTKKERIIQRKEIEGAHKELLALGQISRSQIEDRHSPRNPAYVAALLAETEGVTYTIRPIVLSLRKRNC